MAETSVLQSEIEQFGKLAGDWWDPKGASAMLHKLNPVRLGYVRDWIDQHWQGDECNRRPLEGKTALDVGCGAGLLAERLAPGGLLILSTPNATALSQLVTITLAEGLGAIPKGTHEFDKFIAPERMKVLMADAGLSCLDIEGIAFSPTRGLHLREDLRLNYLVAASRL